MTLNPYKKALEQFFSEPIPRHQKPLLLGDPKLNTMILEYQTVMEGVRELVANRKVKSTTREVHRDLSVN